MGTESRVSPCIVFR
ncbi:rCG46189 [Rattus norvegicus]|uniref:RCG46189 n=1 Tax=Rattus norvegicus TaxID=10116 RepID=A6ID44_RAT|nr:rCG46189 [Rattus norvegicus]